MKEDQKELAIKQMNAKGVATAEELRRIVKQEEGETFSSTMELRWRRNYYASRILEQKWIGSKGSEQWKEIPKI